MQIDGSHALILGMAREGVSLARFLAERGASVTVTDSAPWEKLQGRVEYLETLGVRCVVGGDHPELVEQTERFFASPGVPETNPVFDAAAQQGLPIESMTTLFFELCPGRIAGITGSSGKTTTTGLIGAILRAAERDVVVGGNIGDPMLDLLPEITGGTIVVLELSSFQLSILRRSPHLAVVTNISPNHLDRHGTMEAYIGAKRNIVRFQTSEDLAILNAGDAEVRAFAAETRAAIRWFGETAEDGATQRGNCVGYVEGDHFTAVMPVEDIPLLGAHNVENVLAAIAACRALGVEAKQMTDGIRSYRPAPHRLEVVRERAGVRYIDDSIATSPARAIVALRAIDAPVILIAGGRDKRLPWADFARLAVQKARMLILIGEAAPLIDRAVRAALRDAEGLLSDDAICQVGSLQDAVCLASRVARPGDAVLLSPGCTSYDMFSDFAERGSVFAQAVEALDAA